MEAKEGKSVFQLYYDDMERARQVGIREVVEFVDAHKQGVRESDGSYSSLPITIENEEWQAQKKKWGVE